MCAASIHPALYARTISDTGRRERPARRAHSCVCPPAYLDLRDAVGQAHRAGHLRNRSDCRAAARCAWRMAVPAYRIAASAACACASSCACASAWQAQSCQRARRRGIGCAEPAASADLRTVGRRRRADAPSAGRMRRRPACWFCRGRCRQKLGAPPRAHAGRLPARSPHARMPSGACAATLTSAGRRHSGQAHDALLSCRRRAAAPRLPAR